MGLTFNNNKRQRIIRGNPREKLYISINWKTNILAYRRNQNPASTRFLFNQWDLLNIHKYNIKLRLNLGQFLNNSNMKHISNSKKTNSALAQLKNKLGYLQKNNTRRIKSINKTSRTRRYRTRN